MFDVNVRKTSDEAERSPLVMASVNWNWSKLCFSKVAGNTSTGDEVGTSWWKQELVMELTGLHVQLKLRRENQKQRAECTDLSRIFPEVQRKVILYLTGFVGKSGS